jgi:hypothetical protein
MKRADNLVLGMGTVGESKYEKAVELARENGHYVAAKLLESFKQTVDPPYVETQEHCDMCEESEDDEEVGRKIWMLGTML